MALNIMEVREGSIACKAGILQGDRLISVNGHEIVDVLDFRFRTSEGLLLLMVQRSGRGLLQKKLLYEEGQDLGIELEDFRAKPCNNKCVFCFVDQLPRGVRHSLKFKDDDFRLSFLHGNYLTLTNLSEAEIDRIIEQRLSPLFVSVHATDPEVRARMLGRPLAHCGLEPMLRLIRGGISIHAQVVLCPGINDGRILDRTILDLSEYHPALASVAIVPLGTSRFRSNLPTLVEVNPVYCEQIIQQAHGLQQRLRTRLGVTFAYLADEFYLQAGIPLPASVEYDGFRLLEDGIGMVRYFDDEFRRCMRRKWAVPSEGLDGTLVTGALFFPILQRYAQRIERRFGGKLRVVGAQNRFMGNKITVAGLLAGQDIAAALEGRELGRFVLIPGECLARHDDVFLDNMSKARLAEEIGVEVRDGSRCMAGFFSALCGAVFQGGKAGGFNQYPRSSM